MGALHQNKWCETEWLGSQPSSGPYKVRVCVCPVQCALGSIKLHNANGFGKDKCPLLGRVGSGGVLGGGSVRGKEARRKRSNASGGEC